MPCDLVFLLDCETFRSLGGPSCIWRWTGRIHVPPQRERLLMMTSRAQTRPYFNITSVVVKLFLLHNEIHTYILHCAIHMYVLVVQIALWNINKYVGMYVKYVCIYICQSVCMYVSNVIASILMIFAKTHTYTYIHTNCVCMYVCVCGLFSTQMSSLVPPWRFCHPPTFPSAPHTWRYWRQRWILLCSHLLSYIGLVITLPLQ